MLFIFVCGTLPQKNSMNLFDRPLTTIKKFGLKQTVKFYLYRSVLLYSKKIIVPSELLKRVYVDCYGIDAKKIDVVPNPA